LRQDALAGHFGVSQTVVREAFRTLAAEGLLTIEPRRGACVVPLDPEEAWETTQLRALLEVQALDWAIPAMTADDFERAEKLLVELDQSPTTDQTIALNAAFHDTLYAPSRRPRTLAMIATLRSGFERYLRFTWTETPHQNRSQEEHRALVGHCRARDTGAACALLKAHILATGDILMERLRLGAGASAMPAEFDF
jgi:DNA-binding GntR family transcriptional regulator